MSNITTTQELRMAADATLLLDGIDTGLGLFQRSKRTCVFRKENVVSKIEYVEYGMPHKRYTTTSSKSMALLLADLRKLGLV